jgi:hypothetical protein
VRQELDDSLVSSEVSSAYQEETSWIQSQLSRLGLKQDEPPTHFISPLNFPNYRIQTEEGNILFKSVPQMFSHEIKLLFYLQGRYPDFFPAALSINPDKNWILLKDSWNSNLAANPDIKLWEEVIQTYSLIQYELTGSINTLTYFECPDRRPWMLKGQLSAFLENTGNFDIEFSDKSNIDERPNLKKLSNKVKNLWDELLRYHIPASLEYGNFRPEFIYINNRNFHIRDLRDSSISHPFFSMSFILDKAVLDKVFPGQTRIYERFRDIYLEPWKSFEPGKNLTEAFETARKLSWIHHLLYYYDIKLSLQTCGSCTDRINFCLEKFKNMTSD